MAVSNSLSRGNQRVGLTAYLTNDAVKNQINNVIGGKNGQRFISSIISAVQTNPALQECSNSSILSSALLGESLKLSPSPQLGHYYLVPFNDSKRGCKVAQFQMGYKGLLQLAIRSGQYKTINVVAIKEGELVKFDPLNEDIEVNLIEDELVRENTPTVGYYASFTYLNGFRKAIYWSRAKMEAHALKYSKGYKAKKGYTFWEKDFDGMAYKTMLRQLISKWGIMSIDMQKAVESDQAVINEDGSKSYVDNTPDTPIDAEMTEVPAEEPKATENPTPSSENDVANELFGGQN
jgi:recombination protein RecT